MLVLGYGGCVKQVEFDLDSKCLVLSYVPKVLGLGV